MKVFPWKQSRWPVSFSGHCKGWKAAMNNTGCSSMSQTHGS